jgi:hypothetical protein
MKARNSSYLQDMMLHILDRRSNWMPSAIFFASSALPLIDRRYDLVIPRRLKLIPEGLEVSRGLGVGTGHESSLVLASRTFAFSASWADLSLAFIIEYSAVRAFARAAQASLVESAQATETNPNPRPNTTLTAIDWLLVVAKLIEFWTHLSI